MLVRNAGRWVWLLAGALALAGCGGDEPSAPAGQAWVPASPSEAAENQAPKLESVHIDPAEPVAGEEIRAVVRAADPDHDRVTLAYAWSLDGRPLRADGPSLVLDSLRRDQELAVRVTASDGRAESEPARAVARVGNRAPRLTGLRLQPSPQVERGATVVAVAEGVDPDADPVSFSYEWRVNGRRRATDAGSLPTDELERGDVIRVRVVASDGDEESAPLESEEVRIANGAPAIVSTPPSTGLEDGFRYRVEARDPDGDRGLRFRLAEAPEGMTIDTVLGEIRWSPSVEQAGTHTVDVVVTDPHGASTAQRFEVSVQEAAPVPAAAAP